jgi:hypothetical protein
LGASKKVAIGGLGFQKGVSTQKKQKKRIEPITPSF